MSYKITFLCANLAKPYTFVWILITVYPLVNWKEKAKSHWLYLYCVRLPGVNSIIGMYINICLFEKRLATFSTEMPLNVSWSEKLFLRRFFIFSALCQKVRNMFTVRLTVCPSVRVSEIQKYVHCPSVCLSVPAGHYIGN